MVGDDVVDPVFLKALAKDTVVIPTKPAKK